LHDRTSFEDPLGHRAHAAPPRSVAPARAPVDELVARDKVSLDLVWLRDESLEDLENLPPPDMSAQEIVEDLEAALAEFAAVAEGLARHDAE